MKKLNKEDYLRALERMKRSQRDRIGILGELGVTGIGTAAGVALSGMIASIVGASTLAGSTTLASIAGGVFVTTTPVGWVAGSAIAGGALAYGLGRLIKSGAKCDYLKESKIQDLKEKIEELDRAASNTQVREEKIPKVISAIQYLVFHDLINQERATEVIEEIEKKRKTIDQVFEELESITAAKRLFKLSQ